ncbi:BRO-N domain containing protein [Saudi moumouvirus]|nr:BRO-N domain containing protein [Saudi moumouvirus]
MWKGIRTKDNGKLCLKDVCEMIKISPDDLRLDFIKEDEKYYFGNKMYIDEITAILLICYIGNTRSIKFYKKYIDEVKSILSFDYLIIEHDYYEYDGNKFTCFKINDYIWFKAKDICNYLKYGNTRDVVSRHVNNENKIIFDSLKKYLFSCNGIILLNNFLDSKTMFINNDDLAQLLLKADKAASLKLASDLGIKVHQKFTRKEINIVKELDIFCNMSRIKSKHQFVIKCDKNKYIVDYYLPEYKIAIEIDEFDHKDRNPGYEKKRQTAITKKLGCKFVRCNPDDKNFNITSLIGTINKHVIEQLSKKT